MRGIDATVLTLILNPNADVPVNPETKEPIAKVKVRIDFLIKTLQDAKQKIVIPTPVLAEVLVQSTPQGISYVGVLQKASVFEIRDFDQLSAIELAFMTAAAIASGDKKAGSKEPWQKIKIDRQIVAVCKVAGVSTLYAMDRNMRSFAEGAGMRVVGIHELPLPPEDPQLSMVLTPRELDNDGGSDTDEGDDEEI